MQSPSFKYYFVKSYKYDTIYLYCFADMFYYAFENNFFKIVSYKEELQSTLVVLKAVTK